VGFEDTTKNPCLHWSIAGRRLLTGEQPSILDRFFRKIEETAWEKIFCEGRLLLPVQRMMMSEGYQGAFEFASLRAHVCEIQVFVKIALKSVRME